MKDAADLDAHVGVGNGGRDPPTWVDSQGGYPAEDGSGAISLRTENVHSDGSPHCIGDWQTMMKSFITRVIVLGVVCLGSIAGIAKVVQADSGNLGAATYAPLVVYNSQSTGIRLSLPSAWTVTDTPLGLQVAAPDGAAIPTDEGSAPRLVLEIDRSDLLASAIAHDGCCRLIVKDPKTGQVVTDTAMPPAPTPIASSLDVMSYASALVSQAPAGAYIVGTRNVGGESGAVVAGLPNNGIPSVTVFVKHHDVLYTITAMGALQLSAEQDAAITSIQLTN